MLKVLGGSSAGRRRKSLSAKWSLDRALCQGGGEKRTCGGVSDDEKVNEVKFNRARDEDVTWQECGYGSDEIARRVVGVPLEREPVLGLGINLLPTNGGLIITQVKPGGPADRDGSIKVGDRLLAVDGLPLTGLSPDECRRALMGAGRGRTAWLTVEYDVSVMTNLRSVGRLLIEIECGPGEDTRAELGLSLIDSSSGGVVVSRIKTASIAERCGAFLPGDQILSLNGIKVENRLKASDVAKLLDDTTTTSLIQVEILPLCAAAATSCSSDSRSSYYDDVCDGKYPRQVKTETAMVTLRALNRGEDFGMVYREDGQSRGVVVCYIEPKSVAARSGVLQVGDRILTANGRSMSLIPRLESLGLTVHLTIEFELELWPRPDKGELKEVSLVRGKGGGFGVTISTGSEGIVISDVKCGSLAYRSGRIFPGDLLVGIDGVALNSMEEAIESFKRAGPSVLFHLLSGEAAESVDSAVESWDSTLERFYYEADEIQRRPRPPSPPCPLRTNYRSRLPVHWRASSFNTTRLDAALSAPEDTLRRPDPKTFSTFRPPPHIFRVTLYKSLLFEDFGFSVSDGLYERGVFINKIKPGSPADLSQSLKPYDRIIGVNDVPTADLDCCMTVPLMAAAGKKLTLTLLRSDAESKQENWTPEETVQPYKTETL